MIRSCLVAFASSAVVDLFMARWVVSVAANDALGAAVLSMGMATCLLTGITEVLGHGLIVEASWVLGYGVGSYAAVKLGGKV